MAQIIQQKLFGARVWLVKSEPIQRLSLNYEGNESTLGQQQRQHHQTDNNCEEMPHSKLEEEDCDFDLSFEDNEAEKAFLQDTDNRENQSQSGSQGPRPPTLGQIQYCIQVLQKVMPQMFTTNIVNIFFQKLFQKLAFSRLSPPVKAEQPDIDPSVKKEAMGLEDNVSKRSFVASQRGSLAHSNHGIRANMQKYAQIPIQRASSLANHSKIKVQDLNYLKRKTVIEAFCGGEGYEGVSTELARLALPLQIDKVSYDRILAEMMLQAYEKAEKVVATGYRIKQGPVVCAEPRSIQKVMVGCRRSLAPPTCQLIFSILLHYCSKGALVMDKDEAMRLLQGINAGLIKINEKLVQSFKSRQLNRSLIHEEKLKKSGGRSQKRDEASKKMKFELHRVWDNQFQKIMIDMYRAGHQIAQIRDKFCQTFPHDTRLFTIAALRSMFFKILRMAIRRLSQQVWKSGRKDLPQLVKLQDQLVKNIINCSECLQIRKLLIEIYIAEICGPTLLTETINLINQYSDSGGGVKKSAAMLQRFDDI